MKTTWTAYRLLNKFVFVSDCSPLELYERMALFSLQALVQQSELTFEYMDRQIESMANISEKGYRWWIITRCVPVRVTNYSRTMNNNNISCLFSGSVIDALLFKTQIKSWIVNTKTITSPSYGWLVFEMFYANLILFIKHFWEIWTFLQYRTFFFSQQKKIILKKVTFCYFAAWEHFPR